VKRRRPVAAAPSWALAVLIPFFSSCVKVEPPRPPLVETVAVLMFDNESNDLNAPEVLQEYVYRALLRSPYRPVDIKVVNDKLISVGILDGGQLAAVDPVKLGKDLGVHALVFGNVETYGYTNIGYFTSRKVTVELQMVSVDNGQVIWEGSGTGADRNVTLDPAEAKRNLAAGLAQQVIDKATKSVLDPESRQAVAHALSSLPGFKFNGFEGAKEKPNIRVDQNPHGTTKTFRRQKN